MSSNKKKAFCLTLSLSGHLNPMCGLVHELCTNQGIECILYGTEELRGTIEKTGAKFRLYKHRNLSDFVPPSVTERKPEKTFENIVMPLMDSAYVQLPQLLNDYEADKPDLILYDPNFIPAKYLQGILEKKHAKVKFVTFYPNFVFTQKLIKEYPEIFKFNFQTILALIKMFIKQIPLSWHFGLPLYSPLHLMEGDHKNIRVVAVFPEIHPRIEYYDRNLHKFVGQCVSEDARSQEIKGDPEMQALMDLFPSNNREMPSNDLKLIYISLGTIFHFNTFIFEMIIEAIRTYNQKTHRKSDSSKFRVVISVGDKSLAELKDKASKGEIILPKNILLRARVPQLAILERAHLFVTHSGMNSTSETIKYAVPIVSIPIEADQPINAKQMCDVLQLGVRLDPLNLSVDGIADAIDQVLSDQKYAKNMKEMSIISAKYNGRVEGAKIIVDYLNQDNISKANPNLFNNPNKIKPY